MSEKNLNVRIIHKHDIEANWLKATNFAPKQGELIVYDKDSNYAYERFKIGDGVTNVSALPFCGEAANIETPSSGTTYKGKWVKFATVTLPAAWDTYSGILNFVKTEGSYGAEGILSYYFRNGSSTAVTDISLSWISLNNENWAASVAAVKITNGSFDLYYKPVEDYEAVLVTAINTYNPSRFAFETGNYVDTITAEAISLPRSYAKSANSAAMLQTYKPGSTTETYGEQYPLMAQWEDSDTLRLYSEDSVVKVDNAERLEGHAADYFATASHTHSNNGLLPTIPITSTNGTIYTATIDGVTALSNGMCFIVVPNINNSTPNPVLNINSLGQVMLKRPTSTDISSATAYGISFTAGMPYLISYYNSTWLLTSYVKQSASDLDGTVPVANGGTGVTSLSELKTALGINTSSVTSGMIRTLNYSDLGYATRVEQTGSNVARFLIVTLVRSSGGTSGDYPYYSMTIDYEILNTTEKLFYGPTNHNGEAIKLYAKLNSSGKFVLSVDSSSDCFFHRIVGYY